MTIKKKTPPLPGRPLIFLSPNVFVRLFHIDRICPLPSPDWSTSTEYAPSPHPIGPHRHDMFVCLVLQDKFAALIGSALCADDRERVLAESGSEAYGRLDLTDISPLRREGDSGRGGQQRTRGPALGSWEDLPPAACEVLLG
eukprot:240746-Prorocentrum_minimum.AAC.1